MYNNDSPPGGKRQYKTACAACKHQRRRCAPNCPLAPFFPAERHDDFVNVYRHFGISNTRKLISPLSPKKRAVAIECMIEEANARAFDPAGGISRQVSKLLSEIDSVSAELFVVRRQLAFCREARVGEDCLSLFGHGAEPGYQVPKQEKIHEQSIALLDQFQNALVPGSAIEKKTTVAGGDLRRGGGAG